MDIDIYMDMNKQKGVLKTVKFIKDAPNSIFTFLI